jgi:hypothetical protein
VSGLRRNVPVRPRSPEAARAAACLSSAQTGAGIADDLGHVAPSPGTTPLVRQALS